MLDDKNRSLRTKLTFGSDARSKILEGAEMTSRAVGSTMGPRGRTVLIKRQDQLPLLTKDGVTVSQAIHLKGELLDMGAQLTKEAATRTNDVAGDGTTTATVLTSALMRTGNTLIEEGHDQTEIARSLQDISDKVITGLKRHAREITSRSDIVSVGTISANGDSSIGELIADAMTRVDRDGTITVEDAKGMTTSLEVVNGTQVGRGYVSPYFVTDNEKMHVVYEDALVFITDKKISALNDIITPLEVANKAGRPILIIADEIESEALQALVINKTRANLKVCAIRAPGFGDLKADILQDLAVLAGTEVASATTGLNAGDFGLSAASKAKLGIVKKFISTTKSTTLVATPETSTRVSERLDYIRSKVAEAVVIGSKQLTDALSHRLASLAGGVAIIKVGGSTEIEMIERRHRIEDALSATRAAVEEGIIPGGGTALMNIVSELTPFTENVIESTLLNAFTVPWTRIITNSGECLEDVTKTLASATSSFVGSSIGWDADKSRVCDLFEAGIIDPLKVTRVAVENAASIAISFITMDAAITEEDT